MTDDELPGHPPSAPASTVGVFLLGYSGYWYSDGLYAASAF